MGNNSSVSQAGVATVSYDDVASLGYFKLETAALCDSLCSYAF